MILRIKILHTLHNKINGYHWHGRIEFKIKFDQYPVLSLSYHFVWQEMPY